MLIAIAGILWTNPHVRSRYNYYRLRSISNSNIRDDAKELNSRFIREMPAVSELETVSASMVPKEIMEPIEMFRRHLTRPTFKKIKFEDKSEGWLVQEYPDKMRRCPSWSAGAGTKLAPRSIQRTAHVSRYEFRRDQNLIFVETRQTEFGCEVDVYLKEIPRTGSIPRPQ